MKRLLAILTLVWTTACFGGSELEDLDDNALLDLAAKQVSRMSAHELDALAEFVSSCESLSSSEVQAFYCKKYLSLFLLKHGSSRAIDTLAERMYYSSELINALSAANRRSEAANLIERRLRIFKTMKFAINKQYAALRTPQQRQ